MLITENYRQLNARMHQTKVYGEGGGAHAKVVRQMVESLGDATVLDYGCGKGKLKQALGNPPWVREYDPAIFCKSDNPLPADIVVCTDVLEHIEPECLDAVLDHLKELALKYVFLVVHTGPAMKHLPDGRNAHLTQQPGSWWEGKCLARWAKRYSTSGHNGYLFVGVAQ